MTVKEESLGVCVEGVMERVMKGQGGGKTRPWEQRVDGDAEEGTRNKTIKLSC